MSQPKEASQKIKKQHNEVQARLPFEDKQDFEDATRGFIGHYQPNAITDSDGLVVWDTSTFDFLQGPCPDTVNPSLWRQSRLNALSGLFRVVDGIYQVRGLDLSNITLVESNDGVIVIDTLTTAETASAALALYREHRGSRPVKAIIYTHCHADHFGGVKGVVSQEDVDSGAVRIFAPEGFLEHAVSENVFTGTAMSRRAAYMYGAALDRGPQSQVGAGLGQTVPTGTVTLIPPTDEITRTGQDATIDGVKMVFQMAPDTEAPAEMLIYLPDFKALCAAEDATHTFHNLLTLRGAVVRDAHGWGRYLTETIQLFGGETEVLFASHHWPTWGADRIVEFLTCQRDLYAYVHDQTLRLINKGFNGPEIADMLTLPPAIENAWHARGYYGSLSHNVKAIYQRYCGWFDGNPSHLWEHAPVERAKRYVELIGGMGQTVLKARAAFDKGDFRWAAEMLNHAVFAEPDDAETRQLLADTYEQLGYGAENGTWRNFYLSGAHELRRGNFGTPTKTASADVITQLTPGMVFDSLALQIDGPKACKSHLSINVVLSDTADTYQLWLSNGALIHSKATQSANADVVLSATTRTLPAIVTAGLDVEALDKAGVKVSGGDPGVLERLSALLDPGDPGFHIVTP